MASKWINAILWTLVSVNLITLVLGGLVTWLGYAIPIRQFGLSPEITQMAGFASLLVACLGLAGLNYSSHYALNAYGLSCAVFIILMLFGVLPDHWQRFLYNPSETVIGGGSLNQQHQQQQQQQPGVNVSSSTPTQRLKPDHHPQGAVLILDLLYIVLLVVLSVLVALAFILAQHLRRRELESDDELATDCCDHHELESSLRNSSGGCGSGLLAATVSRRLLSTMPADDTPDWSCTCNGGRGSGSDGGGGGGGGGINMLAGRNGGQAFAATMGSPVNMAAAAAADKEDAVVVGQTQTEDKARYMPATISGAVVNLARQTSRHDANSNSNDQANAVRWRRLQSATLDRSSQRSTDDAYQRHHNHLNHHHQHQSSRLATDVQQLDGDNDGKLGANAHRLSSKSLANLTRPDDEAVGDDEDVIDSYDGGQEAGLCGRSAAAAAPLTQKGIYYANGCGLPDLRATSDLVIMKPARDNVLSGRSGTDHTSYAASHHKRQAARQSKFESSHNDHHGQRHRTPKEARCCCAELPVRRSSKTTATLVAKLNPATNYNPSLLDTYIQQQNNGHQQHNHQYQHYHEQASANLRSARYANTMPNKLNLSSVYAIRSALATSGSNKAAELASRNQKQSKMMSSGSSVMAMTASAAAALLGGIALDADTFNQDHTGGLIDSSNMDDGHDYLHDPFIDHQSDRRLFDSGTLLDGANSVPNSSNYNTAIGSQHH